MLSKPEQKAVMILGLCIDARKKGYDIYYNLNGKSINVYLYEESVKKINSRISFDYYINIHDYARLCTVENRIIELIEKGR